MNPPVLIAYDLSTTSSVSLCDKETQTSNVYVLNSISSKKLIPHLVPMNIEASKDNVKVFEYCEVIQDPNDPDSVSIVKETFTEEVVTESDCFFDKPTSNKYKYCREVIQPYSSNLPPLKPFIDKNCKPKSTEGDSELELDQENITTENKEESNNQPCNSTMDSDKCKSTFTNPNNSNSNEIPIRNKSSCDIIQDGKKLSQKISEQHCRKAKEPFDESSLKKCVTSCINESVKLAKKESVKCLGKIEKVIGVNQNGDDKPSYYVMEKGKSETSSQSSQTCIPKKNSTQNVFDSQSQTVANITCAIKGFLGSVYNKTKEAVNMVKTESCRHLGIEDKPKRTSKINIGEQDTKDCSGTSLETNIQSVFEAVTGETSKREENCNENQSLEKILEPAKDIVNQVASVVSSTISVLRKSSFNQIADNVLNSKMNKSSPYDVPTIDSNPPKEIAQDREPHSQPSVFAMIKAKFFSMFGDNQQDCQDADDNDDDEHSAEKMFEKYCDQ